MHFLTLNNGRLMPALGYGTWQAKGDAVKEAIKTAVTAGYRHFDTAFVYGNESDVGDALQECFAADKTLKREDFFITTKLWNTFHHPDDVRQHFEQSLASLKMDYVDLYLIHWPMGYQRHGDLFPKDANGKFIYSDDDYLATYKAMEQLVKDGLARAIGISNFNAAQMKRVYDNSTIKPAAIQVECHPYFQQKELIAEAKKLGIAVTAYSPLGSPERMVKDPNDPVVLDDPVLKEIAGRYGKSPAQVAIRFQVQRGISVIPKSVTPSRIAENFDVFSFTLSEADMKALEDIDRGHRMIRLTWYVGSHYLLTFLITILLKITSV